MSKETKHTPLPWRAIVRQEAFKPTFVMDTDIGMIHCPVTMPREEIEANAKHFDRACNSHEALVEALEACLTRLDDHDGQSAPECLQARAVLAQASSPMGLG